MNEKFSIRPKFLSNVYLGSDQTSFKNIKKGGKLSKIKRKFKRNLSSTTDFFFEGMNEKDVQDLLKILNN